MSPGGQSNLLLIRRLLHPSTPDFDPIRGRFFARVLPKFSSTARITMEVHAQEFCKAGHRKIHHGSSHLYSYQPHLVMAVPKV